jgi:hypothetical protein
MLRKPCVARVAKGTGELTEVLPIPAVGRVFGKKEASRRMRLNIPEGDNRHTPYPETYKT